jgi:spermidine synthase
MIRVAALALTVLTGFSGLVYEITWQKYLATLLGSHSEATAAVLALFLGGLAGGYSLFGVATRRLTARGGGAASLLLSYAALEAGIGLWALAFPVLFSAAQALATLLPHGGSAVGFALDVSLSALLIVPPALLMGATIPMLTQALARDLADATRCHALIYALNTAGAFVGALAAGFWLVPALGLVGVLRAMAVVNLFAGAAFALLGLRSREAVATAGEPAPASPSSPGRNFAVLGTAALLCGFAMMTFQTVLIRLGALSFGASELTFSMVVAVFVLCIAIGSLCVSTLHRVPAWLLPADLWGLTIGLALLYTQLQNTPYWAYALRIVYRDSPAAFYAYSIQSFLAMLVVIGPPVALSGAALPLLFHHARREAGGLGDAAGRLYSWNTLGSLLGALIGGYALLHWLDLHHVSRVALGALALAAALVTARALPASGVLGGTALAGVALAAIAALPAWAPERLSAGLFRKRDELRNTFAGPDAFFGTYRQGRQIFYDDDPVASIAVKEGSQDGERWLAVLTNGKSDSGVPGDYPTTGMLGLLPSLLAHDARRVFVVGWGTGVTVGELAALESVQEVVVAEISPAVMKTAPIFADYNLQAQASPKLRVILSDAYRALQRSEGLFDVIVSEPSNPWVSGVEMLYSREFLEAARDRLAPGGVHAQWFHTYETNAETMDLVFRTFSSVFEHSAVWYTLGADIILLGIRDPESALDIERLRTRFQQPDLRAGFERCGVRSFLGLIAHELIPLGVLHQVPSSGELHTLLHPRLSHAAALAFFGGGEASVPVPSHSAGLEVARANSLVNRLASRSDATPPGAALRALAEETCRHRGTQCATLLARWALDEPESPVREQLIAWVKENVAWDTSPLDRVEALQALYQTLPPGMPVTPEEAGRATTLFVEHYHYAYPFPRTLVEDVWRHCKENPSQRAECLERQARAERLLGKLAE